MAEGEGFEPGAGCEERQSVRGVWEHSAASDQLETTSTAGDRLADRVVPAAATVRRVTTW